MKVLKSLKLISILLYLILIACDVFSQNEINRFSLMEKHFESKKFRSVKAEQITFPSKQNAPKHIHTCPAVGYILKGKCLFQVEGEKEQILKEGASFYEPAGKKILHFDNLSNTEELIFITFYLIDNEEKLIEIISEKE